MAGTRIVDGSYDFSGGVNSAKVTTIESAQNPNGLKRTQLAWLTNGTVRDGGVAQRGGLQPRGVAHAGGALFQGAFVYEPEGAYPYAVFAVGGRIYKGLLEAPYTVTDLSAANGELVHPAEVGPFYFCQAERWLVIQAGDGETLPLFWDGTTLRRSNGVTGVITRDGVPVSADFTTTAGFVVPAVGSTVVVHSADASASHLKQSFQLTVPATEGTPEVLVGSFKVVATGTGTETWKTLATSNAGVTFAAQKFSSMLVSPASWTATITKGFKIPAADGTVALSVAWYPGNVGDSVTLTTNPGGTLLGEFTVAAFDAVSVTLKTVSSSLAGSTIPAQSLEFAITSPVSVEQNNGINEIPAAGPMCYHMDRLWYAQGDVYAAGDIAGGPAGTEENDFRDAVLCVTENPLAIGGDGFRVKGSIRGMAYPANLDTSLGQGPLYVFTRRTVYKLDVPVTREDWIGATNSNRPLQTVVQHSNGAAGDRSIVAVNGDLFYQTPNGQIASLTTAVRHFGQWGNTPISRNENRLLQFNDRGLLRHGSGIVFENRLLQTALPVQTAVGVAHQALVPLDFDVISSLEEKLPPVWEGMHEGLKVLQLLSGDFGGLERGFALAFSDADGSIKLWELTQERFENGDCRVGWNFETPAFTWGKEFDLKQLDSAELWVDKVFGQVDITAYYRPDADVCWKEWHSTSVCAARNAAETGGTDTGETYREGFKFPIVFPAPKPVANSTSSRPANKGYQFQVRLEIKGWCRVRGILLYATPVERAPFSGLNG